MSTRYTPDFRQIQKVLSHEKPDRPVLFEFFLNGRLNDKLLAYSADETLPPAPAWGDRTKLSDAYARTIRVFQNAGYDYVTIMDFAFRFPCNENSHGAATKSLNEGALIHDRATFDAYQWPDPEAVNVNALEDAAPLLDGAKFMPALPCGVLENVLRIVGFDALCFMLADDPALVSDIFEKVGSILLRFVERVAPLPSVGIIMSNDDWGFRTQTMIPPADMRKYVFPWHTKIVATAHAHGKPAVLHSCGFAGEIMHDIIHDMKFDGKHSYEDAIEPVETAYTKYSRDIALLGGIDLNFVVTAKPEDVTARAAKLLEQTSCFNYALGTGNSVPDYVPDDNYFAMTAPALIGRT